MIIEKDGQIIVTELRPMIDANATQEARAMRLKGYGNAIQAQTATMFINCFLDTL